MPTGNWQTDSVRRGMSVLLNRPMPGNARKKAKTSRDSRKTMEIRRKDGTVKTIQKKTRRKRFGHTIRIRCPGWFQADPKQKFGDGSQEVPGQPV